MKKTLPIFALLLLCLVACQKKDKAMNSLTQVVTVIDTGYYPPLHDTAYYSGLDSFSIYNNPVGSGDAADTLLVIRTYIDSILVINPRWPCPRATVISDSIQYASKTLSMGRGVVSIIFTNHQLIYKVRYDNECTNFDYTSTFVGNRFWK